MQSVRVGRVGRVGRVSRSEFLRAAPTLARGEARLSTVPRFANDQCPAGL